ncbi:hypothetical protein OC846_006333 [Tilletia horrida]|uniref:Peroxin-5 n=1 Tax=Tilletia horrida TaxID=155126 RepID=A0AAN6GIV8_9BASI|nr:hypothetical protein OC845_006352 [Tilletia horrida]KAK0543672.1 hypothetical protein OC846_006333 [Tilletia horrida]KAK0560027.1 hypothetical protein OC861_006438 [Tilletia horrida]
MSFSNLVGGGAECGPSNPLATLGKRFGQDHSTQRDRFGPAPPNVAGPSSSSIRTQQHGTPAHQQGQDQFFGPGAARVPYDMSPLKQALPPQAPGVADPQLQRAAFENSFRAPPPPAVMVSGTPHRALTAAATPAWAQDFLHASAQQSTTAVAAPQLQAQSQTSGLQRPIYTPQFGGPMGAMQWHSSMHQQQPVFSPGQQQQQVSTPEPAWATAFAAFDQQQQDKLAEQEPATEQEAEQQQRPHTTVEDADELAQTAGRLMETIAHEEDAKFKQSRFLDLMRRLRDREAGIEGTDIVAKDPTSTAPATADVKGKGRAPSDVPTTAIEEYHTRLKQQYQPSSRGMDLVGLGLRSPDAEGMDEMNAMLAEEDAVRENLVRNAGSAQGVFVGDSGDVAARMAEDDAAAKEFARYQRLGAQIPGADAMNWMEDQDQGSSAQRVGRMPLNEPLIQHPHPASGSQFRQSSHQGEDVMQGQEQQAEQEAEEEDGIKSTDDFVGRAWRGRAGHGRPDVNRMAEWDNLQRDWDEFEATSMGIRPVQRETNKTASADFSLFTSTQPQPYRFAPNNPYTGQTKHHYSHWSGLHQAYANPAHAESSEQRSAPGRANAVEESVLEREAAVQDDPTNAQAWYDLGVKQQENEREGLAISALHRAVELEPKLSGAWLALAVSYTNENDRPAALEAIVRWMDSVDSYAGVLAEHRAAIAAADAASADKERASSPISSGSLSPDGMTASAKHRRVTEALIALARHGSVQSGTVDADVQVALGVLFNASEDYDKAVDCFGAALSVRPDDWLLYNRMGATLSNSGRSDEAIKFYHHALSLQPEFVRCHFNLSISYLNMKMYRETAQHIYTALNLQRAESAAASSGANNVDMLAATEREAGGVASSSLWETFRVSLELLNRPDLARLCSQRDIDLFDPNDFVGPEHEMAEA